MARFGHGDIQQGQPSILGAAAALKPGVAVSSMSFGYMFSSDPNTRPVDADRLPDGANTIQALIELGDAMGEGAGTEPDPKSDVAIPGDGTIPAGYTYFGQFVDHDITLLDAVAGAVGKITQPSFPPVSDLAGISNQRTPFLELDSVYGAPGNPGSPGNPVPPLDGARMLVGPVTKVTAGTPAFAVVPGKSRLNDEPRKPRETDPTKADIDREARIGDPRNDENLIVAQLHVAFLKAHNTLADMLGSFDAARTALTKIYQSVVVDDYLARICDPGVLADIQARGPQTFKPTGPLYMPIEFAAAGFRFGHSMVRSNYDFNLNFSPADSSFFFVFTALTGQLGGSAQPGEGFETFPENWIIQWERFLPINGSTPQRARPIDPRLTPILFALRNVLGEPETGNIVPQLAKRNLLRGFLFALPSGQAMATKLGVAPIEISAATTGLPEKPLAPFKDRTPLWFYILTEAKLNGGRLGPLGTRIVAETLVTLAHRSTPSIFNNDGSRNMNAKYKLADIINLAAIQDTEIAGS
jgi:Animal haem peroxidase